MDMLVGLTAADRAGIVNLFDNAQGVGLETAMQMRAVRLALDLDRLGAMTVGELRAAAGEAPTSFTLEKGRLEWLRNYLEEAFRDKRVSGLLAGFVLNAYEVIRDVRPADAPSA